MSRRPILPTLLLALAGLAGAAPGARAQAVVQAELRPSLAAQADALHLAGGPAEALALLERHLEGSPGDYRARWMAARAALAVGVLENLDGRRDERDAWIERAVAHGEAAVSLEPGGMDGRYWLLAAKGRQALHASPRTTARLAQEVWDEAHAILAADSLHAGAHNALGRLHLEVMALPGWKRTLAKLLVGGALRRTSWEGAEHHLERAVELDPDAILHHRDLGEYLRRRGRPEPARTALERALALPLVEPWEAWFQEEARAMLGSVDRYVEGRGAEGPPG